MDVLGVGGAGDCECAKLWPRSWEHWSSLSVSAAQSRWKGQEEGKGGGHVSSALGAAKSRPYAV